jgi:hypothetical protein
MDPESDQASFGFYAEQGDLDNLGLLTLSGYSACIAGIYGE